MRFPHLHYICISFRFPIDKEKKKGLFIFNRRFFVRIRFDFLKS